jgi:hypothetical protein
MKSEGDSMILPSQTATGFLLPLGRPTARWASVEYFRGAIAGYPSGLAPLMRSIIFRRSGPLAAVEADDR